MPQPVAHLYAHVPFCPSKCPYCAFVTHVGSLKLLDPYLAALTRDAETVFARHPGGPLRTVYVGGGTPSMMAPVQLAGLLTAIDRYFGLEDGCEVTLEAHPATVDRSRLAGFAAAGATRLSFGAESLNEEELEGLGRRHSPRTALDLVALAREAGFHSVNVDLMYGVPRQTPRSWEETLLRLLSVSPDHVSLYPLSIEPKTIYARQWKRNLLSVPDDELVAEMYQIASRLLRDAGYEHYEVANWALPGHQCRHNLAYWHNRQFYAIGVGAHGYLQPYRTENVRGTRRYIETIAEGRSPVQEAVRVDGKVEFTETVMLNLRLLLEGLDLAEVNRRFGIDMRQRFAVELDELLGGGLVQLAGNRLTLRESAIPLGNEVWARFLL